MTTMTKEGFELTPSEGTVVMLMLAVILDEALYVDPEIAKEGLDLHQRLSQWMLGREGDDER